MMFFAIQQMNTLRKSKLNFEQSQLNSRKMFIHDQISEIEEKNESLGAAFTSITSNSSSQAGSIFNQAISNANSMVTDAQTAYDNAKKQKLDASQLKVFEDKLNEAKTESQNAQKVAYQQYQSQMSTISALTQTYKNVKAAEEKARLKALNAEEDKIEVRLNEINTEMTMIDKELESATQATQQRAQQLVPKYN